MYSLKELGLNQVCMLYSVGCLECQVKECLPNLIDHEKPCKTFEQRSDMIPAMMEKDQPDGWMNGGEGLEEGRSIDDDWNWWELKLGGAGKRRVDMENFVHIDPQGLTMWH